VRAAIGGLASVAGGGKFGNGAVTAAFGYLFNELSHEGEYGGSPQGQGSAGIRTAYCVPCALGLTEAASATANALGALAIGIYDLLSDTPQNDYMVRLQAQGGGLEASVVINSSNSITVGDGHQGLTQLAMDIGPNDAILRRSGFQQASQWITKVGIAGGAPPGVNRTFPQGAPWGGLRVDINILRGTNFMAGPRSNAVINPTQFGI
jgi:hypothetical protein